ncbi:hypothetical protein [Autumnicola edwardsiae]|uniref:Dihydroorotase n=1 Tax=Autumnicola edwardsiae TaxID=3075594 RepID=A0ABU3CVE6_9FLAO|nr:hypothetical protein [Zunongwangia sp. F297]MDT0650333.1 hypothetical protein [Zunongwangia sp. F297]
MRKLLLITLSLFFAFHMQGQEMDNKVDVEVGSIVEINKPQAYGFKHIHFPRANFIIKRGGIANYNSMKGHRVEITAIETKNDGTRQVELKRVDGRKFFRNYATVKADIDKALKAGEIIL